MIKKKPYNQVRDKKKVCPNCNNKVFNATVICKNIDIDGKICCYMHQNKRTPEYIRQIVNSMNYDDRVKYFRLCEIDKKKKYKKESIIDIVNKIYNPFKKKDVKVSTPKKKIFNKKEKKDNTKEIYFITKKNCVKNLNFIKQTNRMKKKLYKEEWIDDTFDNLMDIENI